MQLVGQGGRVVGTSDLRSGVLGFKSRFGHLLLLFWEVLIGILHSFVFICIVPEKSLTGSGHAYIYSL